MKKKIGAMLLALMMVLSLMAVPAMAYGEEGHVHTDECACEVVARGPVMDCPQCGGNAYPVTIDMGGGNYATYYACSCGWTSQIV